MADVPTPTARRQAPTAFRVVDYPEPHRERTRQLLAAHPEARALQGNTPSTAIWVVLVVGAQLAAAWALRDQPWWAVAAVAWVAGAVADHALWVLIHECAHNMVFRTSTPNALLSIVANLPIVVPGAIAFRKYHLLHHAWQGVANLDADLASAGEARLVGSAWWRKALWMLLFPLAQAQRVRHLKEIRLFDGWYLLNLAVQVAFVAGVAWRWGWTAVLYLLLSSFFAIGLHPLGARWIQEHYLTAPGDQETFSYYGPANRLAFNVGYHNEHHDLMRVPWSRLPRLRAMAPELYEPLVAHRSWTRLWLRFLFDPSLSLFSRITRAPEAAERARAAALAAVPP
jgi:sphingolipid delta-4 desaturase